MMKQSQGKFWEEEYEFEVRSEQTGKEKAGKEDKPAVETVRKQHLMHNELLLLLGGAWRAV